MLELSSSVLIWVTFFCQSTGTLLPRHTHTYTHTHTHTHTYIYIYIYIYMYIYIIRIFWQHFFINTNFVEHNRHFLSTYFLVDPFELPYWLYTIGREMIDISSMIVYFPSTFCPTLGHHQGRIYNKSDATFVCTLLLCKMKSVWARCSVQRLLLNCSINSISS